MRLSRLICERPNLPWVALSVLGAAAPPAALHAALASAAGTIFEAAPFVLAAEVLPRRHAAALAGAGCGCAGNGLPGALSLPATALCWLAFGPWIALGRLSAALALALVGRGRPAAGDETDAAPDVFRGLARLAAPAALASLAAQALAAQGGAFGPFWQPLAGIAGACLGAVVPCATAGVAIAAGFAHPLPSAAAGLLVTSGLVHARPRRVSASAPAHRSRPAAFASFALAAALAAIACRGPSGLVNPRLMPLEAAGAVLALAGAVRRRTAVPAAALVGVGLGCALVTGYAVPASVASETTVGGAFPGQRVVFIGVAHAGPAGTTVQRFAIACCRLDATPVAVRLTHSLPGTDERWIAVEGPFVRSGTSLAVRPERWRFVPAPADPFVYR